MGPSAYKMFWAVALTLMAMYEQTTLFISKTFHAKHRVTILNNQRIIHYRTSVAKNVTLMGNLIRDS